MWLYKGNPVFRRMKHYGDSWAHTNANPCFPTSTSPIRSAYSYACIPPVDSKIKEACTTVKPVRCGTVAFINAAGENVLDYNEPEYTYVNEAFMQKLVQIGWNRDNGQVHMIPIAVVQVVG
jgi:hypothetical protein